MKKTEELELKRFDTHRNGIGGAPFSVAIAYDPEIEMDMIIIQFNDEEDEESAKAHTASLAIDLLTERNIQFGENSWRGSDRYGPSMIRWTDEHYERMAKKYGIE